MKNKLSRRYGGSIALLGLITVAVGITVAAGISSQGKETDRTSKPGSQPETAKLKTQKSDAQPDTTEQTAKTDKAKPAAVRAAINGRELFTREWRPHDSRAHGGDGLGPMFNDSSCVACHNQGGIGGGGPAGKNVDILSATFIGAIPAAPAVESHVANPPGGTNPQAAAPSDKDAQPKDTVKVDREKKVNELLAKDARDTAKAARDKAKEELMKVHPGFALSQSIVLHKFGTDKDYHAFRIALIPPQPVFTLSGVSGFSGGGPIFTGSTIPITFGNGSVAPNVIQANAATDSTVLAAPVLPKTPVQVVVGSTLQINGAPQPPHPDALRLQQEATTSRGAADSTRQVGNWSIKRSQRNTTALFGAGLIDEIPDQILREMAAQEAQETTKTAGRVARLKDDKIGRWGWKAQKASLDDFALTACAVELGLNVPDHEQAGQTSKSDYKAPGLDMNQAECEVMVQFLKSLPRPVEQQPEAAPERSYIADGKAHFAAAGCVDCHVQTLGKVEGLYSDLLLHDMGLDLGDTGSYRSFVPNQPEEEQDQAIPLASNPQQPLTPEQLAKVKGALRSEWRTPPLWGVRDSSPYLHDGRAETLEQAIAFHGGQADVSRAKFFTLKPEEREQVVAFMKTLVAPETR